MLGFARFYICFAGKMAKNTLNGVASSLSQGFADCKSELQNHGGSVVLVRLKTVEKKLFILLSAEAQKYSGAELSRKLSIPKYSVYRGLRRLIKLGLIMEDDGTYPRSFSLTAAGKREVSHFSVGYAGDLQKWGGVFDRSHNWEFRVGVLEDVVGVTSSWRRQEGMDGGCWYRRDLEMFAGFPVEVIRTPSNFLFKFNDAQFLARDSYSAEAVAFGVAGLVKSRLEEEYRGLRLGFPERVHVQVVANHHARVGDEFASWCKANNVSIDGSILSVDASKVLPELEADGPGRAAYTVEDFARVHSHLEKLASGRLDPEGAIRYLGVEGLGLRRDVDELFRASGALVTGQQGLVPLIRKIGEEIECLKHGHRCRREPKQQALWRYL